MLINFQPNDQAISLWQELELIHEPIKKKLQCQVCTGQFFLLTRSHFRTSRTKVRINDHIQLYINAISSFLSGNKSSSFKFEAYRPGDRIPIMGYNKILQIWCQRFFVPWFSKYFKFATPCTILNCKSILVYSFIA